MHMAILLHYEEIGGYQVPIPFALIGYFNVTCKWMSIIMCYTVHVYMHT